MCAWLSIARRVEAFECRKWAVDRTNASLPCAQPQADELDGAPDYRAGSQHEQARRSVLCCAAQCRMGRTRGMLLEAQFTSPLTTNLFPQLLACTQWFARPGQPGVQTECCSPPLQICSVERLIEYYDEAPEALPIVEGRRPLPGWPQQVGGMWGGMPPGAGWLVAQRGYIGGCSRCRWQPPRSVQ